MSDPIEAWKAARASLINDYGTWVSHAVLAGDALVALVESTRESASKIALEAITSEAKFRMADEEADRLRGVLADTQRELHDLTVARDARRDVLETALLRIAGEHAGDDDRCGWCESVEHWPCPTVEIALAAVGSEETPPAPRPDIDQSKYDRERDGIVSGETPPKETADPSGMLDDEWRRQRDLEES